MGSIFERRLNTRDIRVICKFIESSSVSKSILGHYSPLRLNGRTRTATFILSVDMFFTVLKTRNSETIYSYNIYTVPIVPTFDLTLHHLQPISRLFHFANNTTSHRGYDDISRHIAWLCPSFSPVVVSGAVVHAPDIPRSLTI